MQGFWTGGDKSQIDATGLEHQGGTKILFCFLRSQMIHLGAFETVLFSRPKRLHLYLLFKKSLYRVARIKLVFIFNLCFPVVLYPRKHMCVWGVGWSGLQQ